MKTLQRAVLVVGLVTGLLALTAMTGAARSHVHHFGNVTCRKGTIKAGTYTSLRIAGTCTLTSKGTVRVKRDVTVGHRAVLNTLTPGTFNVGGDLIVKDDAAAGLGCNDEVGCPTESNDHIGGDLLADGAFAVVIEQEHVGGDITITGGGGSMDCSSTALFGGPYFATVHDSTVGGDVVVRGVHSCWFGMIRTNVAGDVRMIGNRFGDPDAMEIVTNTVGGNLACFNNEPAAQVGDSGGAPNVVGGQKRGECAAL